MEVILRPERTRYLRRAVRSRHGWPYRDTAKPDVCYATAFSGERSGKTRDSSPQRHCPCRLRAAFFGGRRGRKTRPQLTHTLQDDSLETDVTGSLRALVSLPTTDRFAPSFTLYDSCSRWDTRTDDTAPDYPNETTLKTDTSSLHLTVYPVPPDFCRHGPGFQSSLHDSSRPTLQRSSGTLSRASLRVACHILPTANKATLKTGTSRPDAANTDPFGLRLLSRASVRVCWVLGSSSYNLAFNMCHWDTYAICEESDRLM